MQGMTADGHHNIQVQINGQRNGKSTVGGLVVKGTWSAARVSYIFSFSSEKSAESSLKRLGKNSFIRSCTLTKTKMGTSIYANRRVLRPIRILARGLTQVLKRRNSIQTPGKIGKRQGRLLGMRGLYICRGTYIKYTTPLDQCIPT